MFPCSWSSQLSEFIEQKFSALKYSPCHSFQNIPPERNSMYFCKQMLLVQTDVPCTRTKRQQSNWEYYCDSGFEKDHEKHFAMSTFYDIPNASVRPWEKGRVLIVPLGVNLRCLSLRILFEWTFTTYLSKGRLFSFLVDTAHMEIHRRNAPLTRSNETLS